MPDTRTARTGLDRLIADPGILGDRRVGLLSCPAGVTARLERGVDALLAVGARVTALFGPEHGLTGAAQAGHSIGDDRDERTGLPVVDLYRQEGEALAARLADAGIDVLAVDLPDVGTRHWTYTWVLFDCMRAAERIGLPVVVLDRPNPLGGTIAAGPGLRPECASLVGRIDVPLRHGLTMGELALLFAREGFAAAPEVIPLTGWRREPAPDGRGAAWVLPSPNLATVDTAWAYPATGLIEGTALSEGRGTTHPFELLGAPWVDARLFPALRARELPGVLWRETWFAPAFSKHAGRTVRGVQLHVVDRDAYEPVATGVALLGELARLYPDELAPTPFLDLLWGSRELRDALEGGREPARGLTPTHPREHYGAGALLYDEENR